MVLRIFQVPATSASETVAGAGSAGTASVAGASPMVSAGLSAALPQPNTSSTTQQLLTARIAASLVGVSYTSQDVAQAVGHPPGWRWLLVEVLQLRRSLRNILALRARVFRQLTRRMSLPQGVLERGSSSRTAGSRSR